MKVFRITTEVTSTKTIQYIVEANSQEEAELKIIEGEERGEGEEVDEDIEWRTEILTKTKFIEDLED
jgi:adenosine/AMP kinase